MITHLSQVPWLGILAGSVAFSALGALWFAALFAKPYAAALGRSDLPAQKPGPLFIVGPLLCGVAVTVTNALMMQALDVRSYAAALEYGAVTGIGYLVAMTVNISINDNFPRPLSYSAVNAPYFLLGNLANCAILAALS